MYGRYNTMGLNTDENSHYVFEIKTQEDLTAVVSSNKIAVIDIYSESCGPCKSIAPRYSALAKDINTLGELILAKENIASGLRSPGEVTAVPTFLLYKDGKVVDTLTGANLSALKEKITVLLHSK